MRRSTIRAAAAGGLLMIGLLSGCGDDSNASSDATGSTSTESTSTEEPSTEETSSAEDYCGALQDAKQEFSGLDNGDLSAFGEISDRINSLADQAPEEVSGQWQTLATFFDDFQTTLADAGIEPDQLDDLQKGEIPEGVDVQALQEALTSLQSGAQQVQAASDTIAKHAKAECDIDLNASN